MNRALGVTALLVLTSLASGQAIYPTIPDWDSSDTPYSTGGAFADLDGDGWLDFVVSNGNDMRQERIAVYYNNGDGTLPATPDWQSGDTIYNGHLDVADVNGDGWLDVAVATLGSGSVGTFRPVRVYLNNSGTLSSLPDWSSSEVVPAFDCKFGDVNNDGRPDLAAATGWSYGTPHQYHNYVWLNVNGTLQATAAWTSADTWDYQGCHWVDADSDGWLDLVGSGTATETRCYRNLGGTLETTASWSTADSAGQDGIMVTSGDINGDGYRDLFCTDNTQLSGSGRFKQYSGLASGYFQTAYSWSYYDGYGSAVALADLNGDGHLDLATGAWWDKTRLFLNTGSGLTATPSWNSAGTSVVEKIVFGDIDKNSVRPVEESFPGGGGQHLFYLAYAPLQELTSIELDGTPLTPAQYTFSREHGWLTVSAAPATNLTVRYTVSTRLDMGVTNWDDSLGNYLYYNQLVTKGDANCDGLVNNADIPYFVMLLTDRAGYDAMLPDCDADTFCDMDDDGSVNNGDIPGFVAALTG